MPWADIMRSSNLDKAFCNVLITVQKKAIKSMPAARRIIPSVTFSIPSDLVALQIDFSYISINSNLNILSLIYLRDKLHGLMNLPTQLWSIYGKKQWEDIARVFGTARQLHYLLCHYITQIPSLPPFMQFFCNPLTL